ncbi:hypothetical protein XENTR_v10017554 [Xenopus tropicalis]|uniref:Tudor domain-containing protein 1 isoform X2 n=1 Tax=Xenopus tropicalis TaxID=8364 RepID=A0A8J0R628_XENTR|nr:tudor domain-containing protein 1 isoform X2 [Xenopus tropicalis]KAE8589413.1 hypothetical protein XENTR_v10017554 [Xenopus tropicalis]|eukprot:XP_004919430.1 PREDICTED: tudor domain-containing protein 1 isoform X2 [Xenopus tropicalis]
MTQKVHRANEIQIRAPQPSLRCPRSFPPFPLFTDGAAKNDGSEGIPDNSKGKEIKKIVGSDMDVKGPALKPRSSPSSSESILSIGYEPTLFNSIKPVARPTSCNHCGARRCSQCRQAYYCSADCQRKDWSAHSIFCKPLAAKEQGACRSPTGGGEQIVPRRGEASPVGNSPKTEELVKKIMFSDLQESGLREGKESQGFVLDFLSPSKFNIQVCNTKSLDSLVKVSTLLKEIYTKPENLKKGYTPAIGEVCVARYAQDQNWYRVMVHSLDAQMKMAQVLYLDYGNTEAVSIDDVQQMHKDVELFPPSAIKCFLANIAAPPCGWTPECLVDVRKLLLGKKVTFTVLRIEQEEPPIYGVDVTLPSSGDRVGKYLLDKGYCFSPEVKSKMKRCSSETDSILDKAANPEETSTELPPTLKVVSVSAGDIFNAVITDIQTPSRFFCQQLQNGQQLAELMESMEKHYKTAPVSPGFSPIAGEICSALFTEDNRWYRATVLDRVSEDSALVGYVDFGNVEHLPVSRLRPIPARMLAFPLQAIQCSLEGVRPASKTWTKEATTKMASLVANKMITVRVITESEGSLMVELLDGSVNPELDIARQLILAGLAVDKEAGVGMDEGSSGALAGTGGELMDDSGAKPGQWTSAELPLGRAVDVSVCMLYSPGEFFCQLCNEKDAKSLTELNRSLGQHCQKGSATQYNPKAGKICCAFFSGDGNWYRAMVMGVEQKGTKVRFMDYGNTEELEAGELCDIPSQLLELPFQAIRCSLTGVKPIGEKWDRDAIIAFQSSVAGVKLKAKAVGKNDNGYRVELVASESGSSVSEALIAEKVAVHDTAQEAGEAGDSHPPRQKPTGRAENISMDGSGDKGPQSTKTHTPKVPDQRETLQASPAPPKEKEACVRTPPREDSPSKTNGPPQGTKMEEAGVARCWTSIELPLHEAAQALVLCVISPDLFYAFPKENRVDVGKLQQTMIEMAAYCSIQSDCQNFRPAVGDACCARFTGDGQWYRAIVLGTSETEAEVAYADYGNTESLPYSSLVAIKESFLDPPVQIIKCRLTGVKPLDAEWIPAATRLLRHILLGCQLTVTAMALQAGVHSVAVEIMKETGALLVQDKLINEGMARQSNSGVNKSQCKERDECCCCQDLRIRVEKMEAILQHLMNELELKAPRN